MTLRIGFVVHTFDMGGLERCAAHLANHLDRTRFQPLIIAMSRNGTAARWLERPDVPIVSLGKRPGHDWSVIRRLAGVLRDHQVDVVQSHNWGTLLETVVARRLARTPVHIHAEHGLELSDLRLGRWHSRIRHWFKGWGLKRADAVVVVADVVRRRLIEACGFPESRVRFLANGVESVSIDDPDTDRTRIREQLGIPSSAIVIGSVGRMAPVKDLANSIAALGQLVSRGRDVYLLLVGDGPERAALEARARECDVADRVLMPGQQSDVGAWLSAMDVFVNCSLSEAMSLSILEAMSAGLPMVVTDVGESAAMVTGDEGCGIAVPPANPAVLAEALESLVAAPERRAVLRERARTRFAARYTVERMVSAYERLYEDATGARLSAVRASIAGRA